MMNAMLTRAPLPFLLLCLTGALHASETPDQRVATPVSGLVLPEVPPSVTTTPAPHPSTEPSGLPVAPPELPGPTPTPSASPTPLPEPIPVAAHDASPSPSPSPSVSPLPTPQPTEAAATETGEASATGPTDHDASAALDTSPTDPVLDAAVPAGDDTPEPTPPPVGPFALLDSEVPPGSRRRLSWYASDSFTGLAEPTPVLVAHGQRAGPVLCLTAAIHGDEVNGIEMVRRVLYGIEPEELAGTVIGVPIVNLQGYRQGSRYLPDRRDLNRHFPGHPRGSAAARIAYSLFNDIVRRCDALVDLHTGSFHRTNLPQVRGDLGIESVVHLTKGFGATAVLNSEGPVGSLRRAATDIGIPAITLEAGEPMRFQSEEVDHGVRALRSVLNHMQMVPRFRLWGEPQPIYYESVWLRVNDGGILTSVVPLGARVSKGQLLGEVTDPITNRRSEIRAAFPGRVLGMALNQSVIPGFAAYHVGVECSEEELAQPEAPEAPADHDTPPREDPAGDGDDLSPDAPERDPEAPVDMPDPNRDAPEPPPPPEPAPPMLETDPAAGNLGVEEERPE